jgi:hypothetical protein
MTSPGVEIVEPVSTEFEQSLWIRNLEIEILRAETGTQHAVPKGKLSEIWTAETRFYSAKSRKSRGNFLGQRTADRDRTCWLG